MPRLQGLTIPSPPKQGSSIDAPPPDRCNETAVFSKFQSEGDRKMADVKQSGEMIVTQETIMVSLSQADQEKLKKCLERGKLKMTFAEIPVTKLPLIKRLAGGTTID